MKKRNRCNLIIAGLTTVFAVVALLSTNLGIAQEGLVTTVYFDCDANGGDVDKASTKDYLTVKFYGDRFVQGEEYAPENGDWGCGEFDSSPYFFTLGEPGDDAIQEVRIEIDGDDAFWIDQVKIYVGADDGSFSDLFDQLADDPVDTWGKDNTQGWCLSTDTDDWSERWSDNVPSKECSSCIRFVVGGDVYFCD